MIPYCFFFRISHVLTLDCQFDEADKAIINANGLLAYFESYKPNCAMFYTTCSIYMYSLSQYDKVLFVYYCFIVNHHFCCFCAAGTMIISHSSNFCFGMKDLWLQSLLK